MIIMIVIIIMIIMFVYIFGGNIKADAHKLIKEEEVKKILHPGFFSQRCDTRESCQHPPFFNLSSLISHFSLPPPPLVFPSRFTFKSAGRSIRVAPE